MRSRILGLGLALIATACHREPPPVGPQAQAQQPPWTPPIQESRAPAGNPELPIDPSKPMPDQSMSTNARLALGTPASVTVDGRADVYSAGLPQPDAGRGGRLPVLVVLAPGGGYITFSSVKGVVGCMAGATTPPDGGSCAGGNTDIRPAGAISGIVDHQHTQFLVGVFLGPTLPTSAPLALDFSERALGESSAELAPALGQTFYIGDGFTRSGLNQRFTIPPNATRFYLAFADAFSFQGTPGAYGDNTGGLSVTLTQAR